MGIHYVREDGSLVKQTYAELLEQASALASFLYGRGLTPGDRCIVATQYNYETIPAFWACILAGVVPTILQPPVSFHDTNPAAIKLINVFRQLNHPYVILSRHHHDGLPFGEEHIISFQDMKGHDTGTSHHPDPDDVAYIQYSSGSTGNPKGVRLTHRNIASNISDIIKGIDLRPADHGGNWMPLYHDMGLIGYHLTPVFCPCEQYLIEPSDFIKNPMIWLQLIHHHKITISGCPNFGQALVLRYLKRKEPPSGLDLSSMKALLNGAEPIAPKIMEDFITVLEPHGFPPQAMMPVYGMAEATLAISFSPLQKPPLVKIFDTEDLEIYNRATLFNKKKHRHGRPIVSVGIPLQQAEIRITDEQDHELDEGFVGHIQIKGPSVTKGYESEGEETGETFCGEWLRTGDLGFLHEGNLYISGRYKDIILINGKNYFAHDLEYLACTLEEIDFGKVVFGGVTDPKSGKEKVLAFVAGLQEHHAPELLHRLRLLLRKTAGVPLDELIPLRPVEIPKTSSGKLQRYKLLQQYKQGYFSDRRIR